MVAHAKIRSNHDHYCSNIILRKYLVNINESKGTLACYWKTLCDISDLRPSKTYPLWSFSHCSIIACCCQPTTTWKSRNRVQLVRWLFLQVCCILPDIAAEEIVRTMTSFWPSYCLTVTSWTTDTSWTNRTGSLTTPICQNAIILTIVLWQLQTRLFLWQIPFKVMVTRQ